MQIQLNYPVEQCICMKRVNSVDAKNTFISISETIPENYINWENIVFIYFDRVSTITGFIARV